MLVYQRVTFYLEIQWCFKFQLAHVQQIASRFGVSMLGLGWRALLGRARRLQTTDGEVPNTGPTKGKTISNLRMNPIHLHKPRGGELFREELAA